MRHGRTGARARTYGCAGETVHEFRKGAVGEALPPSAYFRLSLPRSRSETAIIGCCDAIGSWWSTTTRSSASWPGELLAASGLTVVGEADSVAAALAAAARLEPSAVLVDVELPDGDGVALARELAALPVAPAGRAHLDQRRHHHRRGGSARRRSRVREQGRPPERATGATARRRIASKPASRGTVARCQTHCGW